MSAKLRIKVENTTLIGAPPSGYISLFTGADVPTTTAYTFNHISVLTPGNELFRVPYLEEDLTAERGLAFGGNVDITGNRLRVSGDTYLGNSCLEDELHVNAAAFFYCNTTFIGGATLQNATFSGNTTLAGNVYISGFTVTGGDVNVGGSLDVTNNVYITGDTTLCGDLNLCDCNGARCISTGLTGDTCMDQWGTVLTGYTSDTGYSQTLKVSTITGCSTIVMGQEVKIGHRNTPTDLVKTNLTEGLRINSTKLIDFPITFSGATYGPNPNSSMKEIDIIGTTGCLSTGLTGDTCNGVTGFTSQGGKFILQSGYTYQIEATAMAVTSSGESASYRHVQQSSVITTFFENACKFIATNNDGACTTDFNQWTRFAFRQEDAVATGKYLATVAPSITTTASTLNNCVIGFAPRDHSQTLGVFVSGLTTNTPITWNVTLDYKSVKFK